MMAKRLGYLGLCVAVLLLVASPLCAPSRANANEPLPPHEEVQRDILTRTEEMPMIIFAAGVIIVFLAMFIHFLRVVLQKL